MTYVHKSKLIDENDPATYIVCPLCNRKLRQLEYKHLKAQHHMTMEKFKEEFPNFELKSEAYKNGRTKAISEAMKKVHKIAKQDTVYANRYLEIGKGRKKTWDSCSDERRKEIGMNATKFWREYKDTLSEEEYQKYEENRSLSIKKYWDSLTNEEKQTRALESFLKNPVHSEYIYRVNLNGKNYSFRAKWEIYVAEFFIENNIEFEYEKKFSYIDHHNKNRTYLADFFLNKYNVVLELKGRRFYNETDINNKKTGVLEAGSNYELIMYDKKNLVIKKIKNIINKYES